MRSFAQYLREHIPGNPTIVVQNMPGAGGLTATNHLFEQAPPDGSTILYGPWDPLAQALGDQGLRARYQQFEFVGGTSDIRVRLRTPDLRRRTGSRNLPISSSPRTLLLGAMNNTDISGLLSHLALRRSG